MTPFDRQVAGRTLWMEARGEPLAGQMGVADVFINRLKSNRWGKSLAEVCLWHAQFSGWSSSDPNFGVACRLPDTDPMLMRLNDIIDKAFVGPDTVYGAMFYYAVWLKPVPLWASKMFVTCTIGQHIFLTENAKWKSGASV